MDAEKTKVENVIMLGGDFCSALFALDLGVKIYSTKTTPNVHHQFFRSTITAGEKTWTVISATIRVHMLVV